METASRTENAKRNIVFSLLERGVQLLLPFFVRSVFIQCLGSEYLGLSSLFSSLLQILSLAELGFSSAMVFSMYEPIAKGDDDAVCALLNLYRRIYRIIGLIITAAGLLLLPFLQKLIHGEIPPDVNIYILYLITLFNTVISYFLFSYKSSLLNAGQRADIVSRITLAKDILHSGAQIAVLLLIKSYYAYVILLPLFTIANNIATHLIAGKLYPRYSCHGIVSEASASTIRKKVAGVFIYKIANVFRDSFDSIVISAFLGLSALGKFSNYYSIVTSLSAFVMVFRNSITAGIGNSIVTETVKKNYADFKKLQLLYMWISGTCTVCLYGLLQSFMKVWLGEEMLLSPDTAAVFTVWFFAMRLGDISYAYRTAAGLFWEDRWRPLLEAIMNLGLNILLVRFWGIPGILWATVFCLVFINAGWGTGILYRHYFRTERFREYLSRMLVFSFSTILACAISRIFCSLLIGTVETLSGWGSLILLGIICLIVPNLLFFFLFRCLPEYNESLSFARNLLHFGQKKPGG